MSTTADNEFGHRGSTRRIEDHEDELIHDLGRRLGSVWEYDRNIADAVGRPALQEYWRGLKSREQNQIDRLKSLIERPDTNPIPLHSERHTIQSILSSCDTLQNQESLSTLSDD